MQVEYTWKLSLSILSIIRYFHVPWELLSVIDDLSVALRAQKFYIHATI